MKIKTKKKTIIALVGLMVICLFITNVSVKSMPPPEKVSISNIIYPDEVREGKIFEINVYFLYEDSYYLHGSYIWLIYSYTRTDAIASYYWRETLNVPIPIVEGEPSTPSNILISFNTSTLDLEEIDVDVTFCFKIKYDIGHIDSLPESVSTEWYELTILDVRKIGVPSMIFVIPLLMLSVIVLIRKKGEKE